MLFCNVNFHTKIAMLGFYGFDIAGELLYLFNDLLDLGEFAGVGDGIGFVAEGFGVG